MKHRELFNSIYLELLKSEYVTGILLMGSVAQNINSVNSDLDIIILSSKNEFFTEVIDNILVEYTYITYEKAMKKLMEDKMDVYHYLFSEICYDKHGKLSELKALATEKYENYNASIKDKNDIVHWLKSTKIKIESAISNTEVNFIVATTSWKIIEAIWIINNKPTPPCSSVIRLKGELKILPFNNWFEKLFSEECNTRNISFVEILEWCLELLK